MNISGTMWREYAASYRESGTSYGGSFADALLALISVADAHNLDLLFRVFPDAVLAWDEDQVTDSRYLEDRSRGLTAL